MPSGARQAEPFVAVALLVLGAAVTTWAAFSHAAQLVVPGTTMILVGSAWLGNLLARRDVRLFPASNRAEQRSDGEAS